MSVDTAALSQESPTDIAWLPDGTFFITDGYGGKRVAKFDKDGKFLADWGMAPKDPKNPGPNEFDTVHSIDISKDRRLFVVDRGHRRFQVFDENGKFLDMFTTGVRSSPYAHLTSTDQFLWVADGGTMRMLKYEARAEVPAEAERGSDESDGPGAALSGDPVSLAQSAKCQT